MRLISLIVFGLLLPFTLKAGPVNQKNDFQFWSAQRLSVILSPQLTIYLENEYRWGDDASELFFCFIQSGFHLTLLKGVIIGPAYRQIIRNLNDFDSKKILIYTPIVDMIFSHTYRGWNLQNRCRLEYLISEIIRSALLYRNRFQVITPWKLGKMELIPYISEEPFFAEYIGFRENRLIFGGKCFPLNNFEIDFYYMLRYHKSLNLDGIFTWKQINVAGLLFHFNF